MSRDLLAGHPTLRYVLYLLVIRLASCLPLYAACLAAWLLGGLIWFLDPVGRRNQSVNMARFLGDIGFFDGTLLSLFAYRSFCLTLVDSCRLARPPDRCEALARLHTVDPWQGLARLRRGGPLVVATVHANWELLGAALVRLGGMAGLHSAVLSTGDPRLDRLQAAIRRRHGHHGLLLDGAATGLARILADGGVVALAADRDYSGKGRAVPFGAGRRRIPTGPTVLARRHRAPLLPVVLLRRGCRERILLIGRTVDPAAPGSVVLLSRRLAALLRRAPDQWVAFHREGRRATSPRRRSAPIGRRTRG